MSPFRSVTFIAALVATSAAVAQDFARATLPPSHPLIGRWRGELPGSTCALTLDIRADGTRSGASGKERSESEFRMSLTPTGEDFFTWEDRIVRTNGEPGCSGSASRVGDTAVGHVRLHPDGGRFLLCAKEEMAACFAEFFHQGR